MRSAGDSENMVKSSQAANLLMQNLREMVKSINSSLTEIAIEILQQAVQIEQRLIRIEVVTRLKEKAE